MKRACLLVVEILGFEHTLRYMTLNKHKQITERLWKAALRPTPAGSKWNRTKLVASIPQLNLATNTWTNIVSAMKIGAITMRRELVSRISHFSIING